MQIGEALEKIEKLPYLAIPRDLTLEEIAARIDDLRQVRGIYVIDDQGRLQGTLSLGAIIRNFIAARRKPRLFHTRSLLASITSEKVADIMDKYVIYARREDDLEATVDRMVQTNIKEIPVVDEVGRIIANIGLFDLWQLMGKRA